MLSSLTTKIALKKVGLPSDTFDLSSWTLPSSPSTDPRREPNKLRKRPPPPRPEGYEDNDGENSWGSWVSGISIPLTVHPWLTPPPPPIRVAGVPTVGDAAPVDREGRLKLGGGQRTLVVFLRCVGCAFAQNTFLTLRTIANRYPGTIRCVAVSHSSQQATRKWIDLLGGAWAVDVVIDEDRALYAAWGLGLGNVWYLFHPAAQIQGWKEKGWLGEQVADGIQKAPLRELATSVVEEKKSAFDGEEEDEATSALGTKWQEAGAFAVDGKGTVIWGGKALRADDVMNLEEGARILEL